MIAWYDLQQALLSQLPANSVTLDSAVKEVRSIVVLCTTRHRAAVHHARCIQTSTTLDQWRFTGK